MTTQTTPTTPTTTTSFDRALFIQAVAATLAKTAFDPGDGKVADGLSIPATVATSDERRVYCLMSAELYNGDGKAETALAWRIRHAYECRVIGAPSKLRFAGRELSGNDIQAAERETRELIRRMASDRIAERTAKATERLAEAVETVLQLFVIREHNGNDISDLKAAYIALNSARDAERAKAAEVKAAEKAAEVKAAEVKAAEKAAEAKAAEKAAEAKAA